MDLTIQTLPIQAQRKATIPKKMEILELNALCSSIMVGRGVRWVVEGGKIQHGKGSLGRMRILVGLVGGD
jgi:hypothetical protein